MAVYHAERLIHYLSAVSREERELQAENHALAAMDRQKDDGVAQAKVTLRELDALHCACRKLLDEA
jgi:hypothetical protein